MKKRQKQQSLFKQKGWQVDVDHILKLVNYFDVIVNLNDGFY